jgi:hypothetical protein
MHLSLSSHSAHPLLFDTGIVASLHLFYGPAGNIAGSPHMQD